MSVHLNAEQSNEMSLGLILVCCGQKLELKLYGLSSVSSSKLVFCSADVIEMQLVGETDSEEDTEVMENWLRKSAGF